MSNIVYAVTIISEDDLIALKLKTGEKTVKGALNEAVAHYIKCDHSEESDMWVKKLEKAIKKKNINI